MSAIVPTTTDFMNNNNLTNRLQNLTLANEKLSTKPIGISSGDFEDFFFTTSFSNVVHTSPYSCDNVSLFDGVQNTTLNNRTTHPMRSNLLDEDLGRILTYTLIYGLQLPVTSFGIVTNILNIVIFNVSGVKDSVTLSFIALSISDLSYCAISFTCNVFGLLGDHLDIKSKVKLGSMGIGDYISHFIFLTQDVSVVITVFVAVEKCCLVTLPHMFKNFFTRCKTISILVFLTLAMIISYIPIFESLSFKTVVLANKTFVMMDFGQDYLDRLQIWRYFNKLFLPTFSLLVIIICLFIMRAQLKKSVMFRYGDSSAKLGEKETKAITAVAIVIIIFFISSLPPTLLTYCTLIADEFFNDPRNLSFRRLLEHSHFFLIEISASVNIFVYFKYHSRYRKTALYSMAKLKVTRESSSETTQSN